MTVTVHALYTWEDKDVKLDCFFSSFCAIVRLCTEATGSRGEFLMAADIVKVDTAANDLVPDTPLCPPTPNETGSFDGSGSEPDSEPIQLQAGIDVEHSDFLNSVLFDGLRIMITIDTRNAL